MKLSVLIPLDQHSTEHGITLRQLAVLTLLERGPVPPRDIASRLHVTSSAVTGQLDALAARGYVARQAHESDRRSTLAAITPQGLKLLRTAEQKIKEAA